MPRQPQISKTDYSLEIRYKRRDGQWSEWRNKGAGQFESIEIVQKQIRLIASGYQGRHKEVRFERNGKLCDWFGNESGKVIELK